MSLRERLSGLFKGQEQLDLTEGGIGKPLLFLSLPIVVTNLLQTAYNLADTFWLGQFSTTALAAITFAFPMVFLLISLGMGVSVAGSILVAQNTGKGDTRAAEYAASQTVTFALLVSAVAGAVGYFFVDDFLALLGASAQTLPAATSYMQVIALGLPFMFGFFIFISLMRGAGDTVTPMLVMFGTVVLNILIDPVLIFGFDGNPLFSILSLQGLEASLLASTGYTGSGIAGAAIATIFSRALAMVVGLAIMFRGTRGIRIRLRDMSPDLEYAERIVKLGVPASIEGTGRALSVNLFLVIVALFPQTVVAAFGIGVRVFSVIFLPAIAVGRGVETMAGQNIGAGKPDRAASSAGIASGAMFVVLSAMGVVVFLFPGPIVGAFTSDPEVVEVGAEFLRWVAPSFGFIGVLRAYTGAFRGAGKTLVAAAISIATLAVIRLPFAWVASQYFPNVFPEARMGVWAAFFVSNALGALIAFSWYRTGSWRDADATAGSRPAPTDD
ncbi:MATE family efflux transporter [Halomarina oriensis]|uniref:MATE family efflux transporter n=1 Tax=Halomarina oriensis TaxID=671145 RepID=A0A6B0GV80_9EURY|nr:MATE family efflux transporter [Halomarina oriensis]